MARAAKRGQKTQDVAEEFSVNARTVHGWVAMGCPCARSTRGNRFDLGEVAKWKRANNITGEPGRPAANESGDLEAAKLRKENALAAKYEIQVDRERGTLVPATEVKTRWAQKVATAKSKFLGLPAAVAPRLEGMNAAAIQGELEKAVTDILNDLASG
ncbi:MAG TPA: hypothetical protein VHI52_02925 [Verrucomicrobiae bacterium]|nr:hypothetical protein [Verrucomicrobiae bacterium]